MQESKDLAVFSDFFLARQPILDRDGRIWGYELLYRSGKDSRVADMENLDLATASVATCGFVRAQDSLDQTKKIFINYTDRLILTGAPRAMPAATTVVEILETSDARPDLIEEIISLKQDGYLVALDDYQGESKLKEIVDYVDIIKVDVLGLTKMKIASIYNQLKCKKALKLAEKVDDPALHKWLVTLGFNLFQGFYFARPENLSGRRITSGALSRLKLLAMLQSPDCDRKKLIEIIQNDPSITYRLLRFLNTPSFAFSSKVDSVKRAVLLLGEKRLKYWLRILLIADMGSSLQSQELYAMSVVRGQFLEHFAESAGTGDDPDTMLLFGLLSLLPPMLMVPIEEIAGHLPLPEPLIEGYLDKDSDYAKFLKLCELLEQGEVESVGALAETLGADQRQVAYDWARALAAGSQVEKSMGESA